MRARILSESAAIALLALLIFGAAPRAMGGASVLPTPQALEATQAPLHFDLAGVPLPGSPGYREGTGSADIQVEGAILSIGAQAEGMAPRERFALLISANGTLHSVANMTTDIEGEVEAEGAISLPQGSYNFGVLVYDLSSFSVPVLVMKSVPVSLGGVLTGPNSSASAVNSEDVQLIGQVQGGQAEDSQIRDAERTGLIPVVLQVEDTGSSVIVSGGAFSASIGRFQDTGYLVSVTGANVTGPRILLVNLSSHAARNRFSGSIIITLDGAKVGQAGSVSTVLGAHAGDPARFVMLSSPMGMMLLVSIPHFSSHIVAIIPILEAAVKSLLVDFPVLIACMASATVLIMLVYSRRTRASAPTA